MNLNDSFQTGFVVDLIDNVLLWLKFISDGLLIYNFHSVFSLKKLIKLFLRKLEINERR